MIDALKKEIATKAIEKLMDEAKVPMRLHLEVIKKLHSALAAHKKDLDQWAEMVRTHKISKGDKGDTYLLTEKDKKEIASSIDVPIVEKVIEKKTQVIREQPIIKEIAIHDTAEEIFNKIKPLIDEILKDFDKETLDESKLFDKFVAEIKKKQILGIDDIKGGRSFVKDGISYKIEELMHGGSTGSSSGSITYSYDLSSQCNGSNKVFTVPTNTNFIQLTGSDSPIIYKYVTDYTGSGTPTLTLTAAVNAPSFGATLVLLFIV